MSNRATKEALFDGFAQVAKALSNGRRAEIVDVLSNGERSVESLAAEVHLSIANTSQHLQILKNAGLVATRRHGTFVYYRLASPDVVEFWRALQGIARTSRADVERLVRDYLGDNGDVEELTKEELWQRLKSKDKLVVLDVRPRQEYDAGHIPGAVSIPLDDLKKRIKELPKSKQIVAYCRGPLCALAPEATRYLKSKGYRVKRLAEGAPDWAAAGLPLDGHVEE
ncbi:MAG TPA: metalloregulator ArsR/SmtB family transcription factor [Actinomycetota bacterium]|nr:metalloregulator ArsR/SmtB family transcription factor [Actinomycetota bacterium]